MQTATFNSQNMGNFEVHGGGGITTGLIPGYIYVDLPGMNCHLSINSFPVLTYASGPKPSQSIDLGWSWAIAGNAAYMKRCSWDMTGGIVVRDSIVNGDQLIPVSHWVRIPDGVTIA